MALVEKRLDFEHRLPDLSAPDAGFLAASPRREVPALTDGAAAIFDSRIILEYLDDAYPAEPLLPAAASERARVRMIEEICDSRLEAIIFGMTEIIDFKRAEGELAQKILEQARVDAAGVLEWLETMLGDRKWFNGDRFGFGDIAVLPYLQTLKLYKLDAAPESRLAGWFARAAARPSFQRCLVDAKAEVAAFKQAAEKIRTGQWPRLYRDHRLDWFIGAGGAGIVLDGLVAGTVRLTTLDD
jgi:glutathione S-transferase/RNA polymerase-associated protein